MCQQKDPRNPNSRKEASIKYRRNKGKREYKYSLTPKHHPCSRCGKRNSDPVMTWVLLKYWSGQGSNLGPSAI